MGDSKLCLWFLLGALAVAYCQDEDAEHSPTCLLDKRYKSFRKYDYQYETESLNAFNGVSKLRNGPKASCKVELEVPQACSFVLRTSGCTLSEAADVEGDGSPKFVPSPGADAFAAAMEKFPLKFAVEGVRHVKLYPEEGETTTILNIKRGIISALTVPLLEEEKNRRLPTIHGLCKTSYQVNAREDIATDVTITRDLRDCDHFSAQRDYTSPLALFSGMHLPLAALIDSSQSCNYKFDNAKKHMVSSSCNETHLLLPFSHDNQYGATNVGKQSLTLLQISNSNERVFNPNEASLTGLPMEVGEDKNVVQDKDAVLALVQKLATLSGGDGDQRAFLFQKLVTMIRHMKPEMLGPALGDAIAVSVPLTLQALAQCGSPDCSVAVLQMLSFASGSTEGLDPIVYAMGLLSNPSGLLISNMLDIAKRNPSKPVLYGLSNLVKRFYKAHGKVIPEISAVADFALHSLGDCSGDPEDTFLRLRVIGNMAAAMGAASPALSAAVIQCVNQPVASPAVQQAAIQVFKQIPVPVEGRGVLMKVLLDSASPLQKRIAAYLVLMKDPQPAELATLAAALPTEQEEQAKSYIISHLTNILSSTAPENQQLRQKILNAFQSNEVGPVMDFSRFSRNYKLGSLEGNMIYDTTSYLPKEVMLDWTLLAFGYDVEMVEVGLEGEGLEPTVEALFGPEGFFPDTTLRTMYFVSDNMPVQISEYMKKMMPALSRNRKKRQTSQNLMRDIGQNLNKLMRDLNAHDAPEVMVYLRLLGNELGYFRTNDMEEMVKMAALKIENLLQMIPNQLIKELLSKTEHEVFAHYIFMDNEFFLPTGAGIPLKVALSGTFTPGIKAGLNLASDEKEISFMPSAGVEFVTQMGAHIPEYVDSGLKMYTSLFHESGINAKITMGDDLVKVTLRAPDRPTKLISISNSLMAVTSKGELDIWPIKERVDVSKCSPFFTGMKYCTTLQYSDASSLYTAPYFPLTGDSKFAVELHPTGEVSEYTATFSYERDTSGENEDMAKVVLKAEGSASSEATATVKYNRRRNTLSTDLQIPDYDLEVGIRLGTADRHTKEMGMHSVTLDLVNKNVPQASLVVYSKIHEMKEAMLQAHLVVPCLSTNATVTAHMKRDEGLTLELQSDINLPYTSSMQRLVFSGDHKKVGADITSDMSVHLAKLVPDELNRVVNDILDKHLGKTNTKLRHLLSKAVVASNNFLEKQSALFPFADSSKFTLPEISLPEKLFLNYETGIVYHFNTDRFTIALPLLLGGKSSKDLNFPEFLTTPKFRIPLTHFKVESVQVILPEIFVPENYEISLPLFGKIEGHSKVTGNYYSLEGSMNAGKDPEKPASFSHKFAITGKSPVEILSFGIEGSGLLESTPGDSIKAEMKVAMSHKLISANISIMEVGTITDRINIKSNSHLKVRSPLGLFALVTYAGHVSANAEEISADGSLSTAVRAGLLYSASTLNQSFVIFPSRKEAKMDSVLKIEPHLFQTVNIIAASFANGELSVVSKTSALDGLLTNEAEVTFKNNHLSLKSDTDNRVLGVGFHTLAKASVGSGVATIIVETGTQQTRDSFRSVFNASLDVNGFSMNNEFSFKLDILHFGNKAIMKMNKDGLVVSSRTFFDRDLENTFHCVLDHSKFTLDVSSKGNFLNKNFENVNALAITPSNIVFSSKARGSFYIGNTYAHELAVDLKPFIVVATLKNDIEILYVHLIHEAKLEAGLDKFDLTGSLKGDYSNDQFKHTYDVNYSDLTATVKCSTTGQIMGSVMTHNTELEIIGLVARVSNKARLNSQMFRYDNTILASVAPFDVNVDAIFNADGDLDLFGKQSTQLFGKFLLKAKPLAFVSSHEFRASTSHEVEDSFKLETSLDNKMDTVLSPSEQSVNIRLKSKVNNHAFNQEVSTYNTAEKLGLEMSGTIKTSVLNMHGSENQDYSASAFLKYDKNSESHNINLPVIEKLPVMVDNFRIISLSLAEALYEAINREENKFIFDPIRTDVDLETFVDGVLVVAHEVFVLGMFSDTVSQKFNQDLRAIDEEYGIRDKIITFLDAIERLIHNIDLENLREYRSIKQDLERIVHWLKQCVEDLDVMQFAKNVQILAASINPESVKKGFIENFPKEEVGEILEIVFEPISNIDVVDKLVYLNEKLNALAVQLQLDKKIEAFLERYFKFLHNLEIEETIQKVANRLFEWDLHAEFNNILKEAIDTLKTTNMKQAVDFLNKYLEILIQFLQSFDYNNFVDEANIRISVATTNLNELIQLLEIPKKLKVSRDYINFVLSLAFHCMDDLRSLKVSDGLKKMKKVVDVTALNEIKHYTEKLRQALTTEDLIYEIKNQLEDVSDGYVKNLFRIKKLLDDTIDEIQEMVGDQNIFSEVKQIVDGIIKGLKTTELKFSSLPVPLTSLHTPAMVISLANLDEFDVPAQFDFPEFTILGFHTVPATTVMLDDIKQKLIELLLIIEHIEFDRFDVDSFFGELTLSYMPALHKISFPEITFPNVSLPLLPKIPLDKIIEIPTLQIPVIKLPAVSSEVSIPAFGKLHGEVRLSCPIYTLKTSLEFQNSTESETTPQFTTFLTSQGTSPMDTLFNYNLDFTTRFAIPKMSRLIVAETLKFTQSALKVEHQASVTFYGISTQATAKTTVKVDTDPYKADIVNNEFFAMEGGMTFSSDTTYNQRINIPAISYSSETSMSEKILARQDGFTITVTDEIEGTTKHNFPDSTDNVVHKADLKATINPSIVKLTYTHSADSGILKLKQTMTVDGKPFRRLSFEARGEVEGPTIKNSLLVATGSVHLGYMKVELKVYNNFEGTTGEGRSNSLHFLASPVEIVIDYQNKLNTKIPLQDSVTGKIEMQNDYFVTLRPDVQHINTLALARFNQYKYFHNFTMNNNKKDAGIYAKVNIEANLDFLNQPITIPEMMFFDITTPAVSNFNLYQDTGLKHLLTTTEQSVDLDTKIQYQKSEFPFPSMGKLITELHFKSAIFTLNTNAALDADDDLVLRVGATTASVFDSLKTKLDGTTSLTTRTGLKLATALTVENPHVKGTHHNSVNLNVEDLEAAISINTVVKVSLPIINLELNQQLSAESKAKLTAASTLKLIGDYNIPQIFTNGKVDADHSFNMGVTFLDTSLETVTKANVHGTFLQYYTVVDTLSNEGNLYLNLRGLRSTFNTNGSSNIKSGERKVFVMDMEETFALEATGNHMYAELRMVSDNEANMPIFSTHGKQGHSTILKLEPLTALDLDVELGLSQWTSKGQYSYLEKLRVKMTDAKQNIYNRFTVGNPTYWTGITAELEGDIPEVKATLKASANSSILLLEYNADASVIAAALERGAVSITSKGTFTHSDLNVNILHLLNPNLRKKRQDDGGISRHILSVDVTSPTFTDAKFRYAEFGNDTVNAYVSTPSTGRIQLDIQNKFPEKLEARLYSQYASVPGNSVDIALFKASMPSPRTFHIQGLYSMDAMQELLLGLERKVPSITAALDGFVEYHFPGIIDILENSFVDFIKEAHNATVNRPPGLSQLSILYRNIIVQSQKVAQIALNVTIDILREGKFQLPGFEARITVSQLWRAVTTVIAHVLEQFFQMFFKDTGAYIASLDEMLSTVQIHMSESKILTGGQFLEEVWSSLRNTVLFAIHLVRYLQTPDEFLQGVGKALQNIVEEGQYFIDNLNTNVLDPYIVGLNYHYERALKDYKELIVLLSEGNVNKLIQFCLEIFRIILQNFQDAAEGLSSQFRSSIEATNGKVKIDVIL